MHKVIIQSVLDLITQQYLIYGLGPLSDFITRVP